MSSKELLIWSRRWVNLRWAERIKKNQYLCTWRHETEHDHSRSLNIKISMIFVYASPTSRETLISNSSWSRTKQLPQMLLAVAAGHRLYYFLAFQEKKNKLQNWIARFSSSIWLQFHISVFGIISQKHFWWSWTSFYGGKANDYNYIERCWDEIAEYKTLNENLLRRFREREAN